MVHMTWNLELVPFCSSINPNICKIISYSLPSFCGLDFSLPSLPDFLISSSFSRNTSNLSFLVISITSFCNYFASFGRRENCSHLKVSIVILILLPPPPSTSVHQSFSHNCSLHNVRRCCSVSKGLCSLTYETSSNVSNPCSFSFIASFLGVFGGFSVH